MASKRAQAAATGNREAVTRWDLAISNLNSNKNIINIQDRFNDFEINGLEGERGALPTFDFYRSNLMSATDDPAPMIINGVRYGSAKEYWQSRFNNFVENNFFNLYQQELNDKITTASNRLTPVLESQLKGINAEINDIFSFSEMDVFADKLNSLKTSINFLGASKIGEKVFEDYMNGALGTTTIDNFNNAINKLRAVNRDYDVDVTSFINTIINDLASKKAQVAQQRAEAIAAGATPEEAEAGIPAVDIPAPIVAQQDPSETAQDIISGAGGEFDITPPADIEPAPIVAGEPQKPKVGINPFTGEPDPTIHAQSVQPEPKTPAGKNFREITVQKGETLSKISQRELGDAGRFQEIADFNEIKDPNTIQVGQKIKIQVT